MLPFYLRHYRELGPRFFVFDDSSSDGSAELLAAQADVTLGRFEKDERSFVLAAQRFYNQAWKRSRGEADWVILCNVDEHYYHPDMPAYLLECAERGVTAIPARGFEMVTDRFPEGDGRLSATIGRGMRNPMLDKLSIFNPNAITETNFLVGRHGHSLEGRVVLADPVELRLLHFKYLGLDYLVRRLAELRTGLRAQDIENKWGYQYFWDRNEAESKFEQVRARAIEVLASPIEIRVASSHQSIDGVVVQPLKLIKNERGRLMEVQRADDAVFPGFGQLYVTSTLPGVVKAWYRHHRQTDQIAVIVGHLRLVLFDPRESSPTQGAVQVVELSADEPVLVQIPIGVWHGFRAEGDREALALHMNTVAFDFDAPDEDRLPSNADAIPYRWSDS
jgi:dTDP-4-dehydrorhamnose 3,5-epimerase-like enzyme